MDKNSEVVFHPVSEEKQAIAENKEATAANTNKIKVLEHLSTHYRKYLF